MRVFLHSPLNRIIGLTLSILLFLSLTGVSLTHALPITPFADFSAFSAATDTKFTIDFDDLPVGPLGSTFTYAGVIFATNAVAPPEIPSPLLSIDWGLGAASAALASNGLLANAIPDPPKELAITFADGIVFGIGLDVISSATFGAAVSVTATELSGGTLIQIITAATAPGTFIGFTSPTGITRLSFADANEGFSSNFKLDNVAITPVAEPGTMLLFASGLAGLVGLVRRRLLVK